MTTDKMVTMLVCGGRNFNDPCNILPSTLAREVEKHGITHIVEGGATGADAMAREWAIGLALPCTTMRANFAGEGRSAGPRRNKRMLDWFNPVVVVAFPGGAGTEDCVRQAAGRGIVVVRAGIIPLPR